MEELIFTKMTGRNVKEPVRAHANDAGIDIFAPLDIEPIVLESNQATLVHTGIRTHIPAGYAMFVMNKSGVAVKKSLDHLAEVIDEGYTGEILINLINVGRERQVIEPGDKIIQVVLLPVGLHAVKMIEESEYEEKYANTERGAGALGSTGTK